ncbi:MAG: hypothetical protein Tsb0013_01480 [Phycisphaerales bacterium]
MPRRITLAIAALVACVLATACASPSSSTTIAPRDTAHALWRADTPAPEVRIITRQTLPGVGAAQGVAIRGGFVYVFGDADTGVIREYTFDVQGPALVPTGRDITLTLGATDLLPHPTGLTFHDDFPALIGDTVGGVGTLFWIDFDRALDDGTLDRAVLRRIEDDLATDGCRPEFMLHEGRLVVATSDHNASPNRFRLYDPERLRDARRTSEPGVLIDAWTCGPFVQSIRWTGQPSVCVLVQNQIRGLRYRLTTVNLTDSGERMTGNVLDMPEPDDELEGFVMLTPDIGLLVSAMKTENATFVRVGRSRIER